MGRVPGRARRASLSFVRAGTPFPLGGSDTKSCRASGTLHPSSGAGDWASPVHGSHREGACLPLARGAFTPGREAPGANAAGVSPRGPQDTACTVPWNRVPWPPLESQTARRRGSDSSEREKLLGADVVQRKGDGWLSPAGASRVSVGPMVSKADLSGHS